MDGWMDFVDMKFFAIAMAITSEISKFNNYSYPCQWKLCGLLQAGPFASYERVSERV
jgi:hypothetical protein